MLKSWLRPGLALVGLLMLAACSRVSESNYEKITDDMSKQDVIALLGEPTNSESAAIPGLSGSSLVWESGDVTITIQFLNDKVLLKNLKKKSH